MPDMLSLVPQSELDKLAELEKRLESVNSQLENSLEASNDLSKSLEKTGKSYVGINDFVKTFEKVEEEANEKLEEQSKILDGLDKIRQKVLKTEIEARKNTEEEITVLESLNEVREDVNASIQKNREELVKNQLQVKNLQKRQKELTKEYQFGLISLKDYVQSTAILNASIVRQQAENKRLTTTIRDQTKFISSNENSYNQLTAAYNLLKNEANNLSVVDDRRIKQLEKLREAQNKYQLSTGNAVHQIGQYEKGNRELLAALQGTNTGVSALDSGINKLSSSFKLIVGNPIVLFLGSLFAILNQTIQAVKGSEEQYARLRGELSAFQAIQDSVTRSFQNLGNYLLDNIDSIRRYGKVLIENIPVISSFARIISTISDATGYTDTINSESERLKQLAADQLAYAQEVRKLNEEAIKDEARISELRAEIADRVNLSDEERLTIIEEVRAQEQSLYNRRLKLAEENIRIIEEQNKATDNDAAANDRLSQAIIARSQIEIKYNQRIRSLNEQRSRANTSLTAAENSAERERAKQLSLLSKEIKAQADLIRFRGTVEAEENRRILTDAKQGYISRFNAAANYYDILDRLIKESAAQQLKDDQLTSTQRQLIQEKANVELIKNERARNNEILKLDQEFRKLQEQQLKSYQTNEINDINQQQLEEEYELAEAYRRGDIKNQTQYEIEKLNIKSKYTQERLNVELESLSQLAALYIEDKDEYAKIQQQIVEVQSKAQQDQTRLAIEEIEKRRKEEISSAREIKRALETLYKSLYNTIFSLANSSLQRQINSIEEQLDQVQQFYEKKAEIINEQEEAGIITAEYADFVRDYYAKQEEQRQIELEEQRKKIQERQAKYEKAQSILSATIATSVAVAKALPNFILAALVGAAGAAQVAAIAAQPLPQYAEGTQDHTGGLAVVGDGGKSELIQTPSGKMFKTPDSPTIVHMPKHSKVFPDFNKHMMDIHKDGMKHIVVIGDQRNADLIGRSNSLLNDSYRTQKEMLFLQRQNNKILLRSQTISKINNILRH